MQVWLFLVLDIDQHTTKNIDQHTTKMFPTYLKSIVKFTKTKSTPLLQFCIESNWSQELCHFIIYSLKGTHSGVNTTVYDNPMEFDFDNSEIKNHAKIDMGSKRITNLKDASDPNDAVSLIQMNGQISFFFF